MPSPPPPPPQCGHSYSNGAAYHAHAHAPYGQYPQMPPAGWMPQHMPHMPQMPHMQMGMPMYGMHMTPGTYHQGLPPARGGHGGHKLFVGMIPYTTGEAELQNVFSQFGPLLEVPVWVEAYAAGPPYRDTPTRSLGRPEGTSLPRSALRCLLVQA